MNIPRDGPLIKHGLLVISQIGNQSSLDPPPRAAFDAGLQSFAVSAVCFAAFSGSGRRSFQAGIKDLGTGRDCQCVLGAKSVEADLLRVRRVWRESGTIRPMLKLTVCMMILLER